MDGKFSHFLSMMDCIFCDLTFETLGSWANHLENIHCMFKFPCPFCKVNLGLTRVKLYDHSKNCHKGPGNAISQGEKFRCKQCQHSCEAKNLRSHLKQVTIFLMDVFVTDIHSTVFALLSNLCKLKNIFCSGKLLKTI